MRFTWDESKRQENIARDGVDFADAVGVFDDPYALSRDDRDHDEERFLALGMDTVGRVLAVADTYRGVAQIRLISAREANRRQRRDYFKDIT